MPSPARIVSVNVARPERVTLSGESITTALLKKPVEGLVAVGRLGLAGDGHASPEYHGGEHQAVYAYDLAHHAHWARDLGADELPPGFFGENLTTDGLLEPDVFLGDSFRAGSSLLQAAELRVPCKKLALRVGDLTFPKRFLASRRLGIMFRVLEEGWTRAGDEVALVERDPQGVSMRDVANLLFGDRPDAALLARALAVRSLSPGLRAELEKRIQSGPG